MIFKNFSHSPCLRKLKLYFYNLIELIVQRINFNQRNLNLRHWIIFYFGQNLYKRRWDEYLLNKVEFIWNFFTSFKSVFNYKLSDFIFEGPCDLHRTAEIFTLPPPPPSGFGCYPRMLPINYNRKLQENIFFKLKEKCAEN